jgi:hypothetical protein
LPRSKRKLAAMASTISYDGAEMDTDSTKRKVFWLLFTVLSLFAWFLPFVWGVVETLVALFASWWLVYRTDIL